VSVILNTCLGLLLSFSRSKLFKKGMGVHPSFFFLSNFYGLFFKVFLLTCIGIVISFTGRNQTGSNQIRFNQIYVIYSLKKEQIKI